MNLLKLIDMGIKFIPGGKAFDDEQKKGTISFLASFGKLQLTITIIGAIIFAILNPDIVSELVLKLLESMG